MSIQQNFPAVSPSLNLNFARSKTLDPRITFSRTTSATRVNELGLIEVVPANAPRFDHRYENGVVRSLGLLIEEQSSNLLPYSVVSTLTWSSINSSIVTNNATTAPDGTNTAARIQVNTNGFVAVLNISVTAGQPYTFSFWVKSVSGSSGTWGINIFDHGGGGFHNRTTRNITGEWTRISYTYTPVGNQINIYVSDDRNLLGTILDGYVWGVQLEQKSFATSHIPTSGSTATRNPDNVNITGQTFLNLYNQNEGSYKVEGIINSILPANNFGGIFGAGGGSSTSNFIFLNPSNSFGQYVSNTGQSPSSFLGKTYASGVQYKIAGTYATNDFACSLNGDISTSTTNNALYKSHTYFRIGGNPISGITGGVLGTMVISSISLYSRRLTNSQLQNLTK